jgi:NAD(P)H-hydrate repair Nnr-like enzyme with NAD(P)H-hydrate dehydratase domain
LFKRASSIVIGPGLSRNQQRQDFAQKMAKKAEMHNLPIVFDGDGIRTFIALLEAANFDNFSNVTLTPNCNEFSFIRESLVSQTCIYYRRSDILMTICQHKSFTLLAFLKTQ